MVRIAVVTGANRGIGFYIAKGLLESSTPAFTNVVLACRTQENYNRTVEELSKVVKSPGAAATVKDRAVFIDINLEKPDSIHNFVPSFQKLFPGATCDVLVNNAGFAFTFDAKEPVAVQAAKTVSINYTGMVALTKAMMDSLMTPEEGRVVILGSRAGDAANIKDEQLRSEVLREDLTLEQLDSFVNKYLAATSAGTQEALGYPSTTYGTSKIAVNAFARIVGAQSLKEGPKGKYHGVTVNVCCPGWCRTDMTLGEGHKTAEEGADTAVWLATAPEMKGISGKFWGERKELAFCNPSWNRGE